MPFSPKERNKSLCQNIVEAHQYIESYLDGVAQSEFLIQHMLQDAVTMRLQQILECAGKLSEDLRNSLDIDWSSLTAMRNRISHAYDEVDAALVWEVVRAFEEFKKLVKFARKYTS